MFRLFASHFGPATLAMTVLFLGLNAPQTAHGQQATGGPTPENPAGGSQYSGPSGGQERQTSGLAVQVGTAQPGIINQAETAATIVCPGGCYGGFHPFTCRAYAGAGYYGFFRRYYGYPFYGPSYRSEPMNSELGYGLVNGLVYRSGSYGYTASPTGMNTPGSSDAAPATNPTRAANTAYLQLIVPRNAEVLVDGGKTTQTGTLREFVSPPLDPDKSFTYTIAVHGTDSNGKTIEENRSIRVRANDQLRIDFTRPGAAERLSVSRPPAP
jgi:uncharacterized protein (TIGR03000 family)